uniref:Uncharacterized protein n=1 Tax=Tanacetum cinerariifolium TaxID=118510 RepID=A0A6L2JZZ8_TANCI|nr:hypothetical protein [Tanacetum cinerariifolium]
MSSSKLISLLEPSLPFLGSYKDIWINRNEAVKVAVQIQSDRFLNEAQAENEEFLKTIDENMQNIIKEQVKIIIEKMEGNKSIHRSNEQRNLYKALVEAYESDKIILDTYGDTVTEGKEPESTSSPKEKANRTTGKSTQGSKSRQTSASESATAEEPMQTTHEMEEPSHLEFETGADDQPIAEPSQHPEWFSQQKKPPTLDRDWNKTFPTTYGSIQPWICELAKQIDSRSSFNELMDTLVDFLAFLMNRLKVDTLSPKLPAGPTYELMKGSCKSPVELEFFLEEVYKATTDQLDWFYGFTVNKESARDVYSKRRIIAVTELKIIEWHNYKNLDWITNVYNKHRNQKACGRPSTQCRKLPGEAQPHEAGYNKDKQNRLMRIDELYKFNAGMLTDVRTALDDCLKGIQMKYPPQTIWRKSDKERAAAMIQAIDK